MYYYFYIATRGGHKELVNFLLENKAFINEKDNFGWTPLHFGILDRIFSLNYAYFYYSLCIATLYGNKELVQILLTNKASINDKTNPGWTALCWGILFRF